MPLSPAFRRNAAAFVLALLALPAEAGAIAAAEAAAAMDDAIALRRVAVEAIDRATRAAGEATDALAAAEASPEDAFAALAAERAAAEAILAADLRDADIADSFARSAERAEGDIAILTRTSEDFALAAAEAAE